LKAALLEAEVRDVRLHDLGRRKFGTHGGGWRSGISNRHGSRKSGRVAVLLCLSPFGKSAQTNERQHR
jgi:hypothetical protein